MKIFLDNEEATIALAKRFAEYIRAGIFTFSGQLGAGKTTFIRALLRNLGVQGAIKSPTYALVESYSVQDLPIHHFDLYRIIDAYELDDMGFREYFSAHACCCIEWPERAGNSIRADLGFSFAMQWEGRMISINAYSALGENILASLAAT